ncbi:hypothetical protein KBC99_00550 [Candidatus Saccharibacteria bacterium]|nr:hypothetical protein [Candidatus Saccharibacteria bacterium]
MTTHEPTRSVVDALRSNPGSELMRRIALIDAEDYTGIARKVAADLAALHNGEVPNPTYVDTGIFALKQYYVVALVDPANAHAISSPLDPFWHAHILHSEAYMRFCDRVIGEYMHHVPLDHDTPSQVQNVRTLYDFTLERLAQLFWDVDREFWPSSVSDAELICYHKGSYDIYPEVQTLRLFEPCPEGTAHAFA